ncbi:vitamin K epoxide reductase family protein [Actinomadura harenae]|uniref:Vitamin K epoxide reductase family protein n=1 Tax=Actinomadura harenae TaxID=2483351 RepID=A0A3M2M2S0_9ACTN|nr:vitamin K epoxide reductase family protein [Actinomadura harenae]RMI41408.1 vitamin K epoxide reductase family protein [Actinomadura harenae]
MTQETAAAQAGATPARSAGGRWFPALTWPLTLAGLAISIYLTYTHYNQKALICSANATVDCHAVTTSKYSKLLGVPLPLLGLLFFVGFAVLITPWALNNAAPMFRWGRLASAAIGLVFIVYLVTVELAVLDKICLWCTGVHIITILLFILVLADEFRRLGQVD